LVVLRNQDTLANLQAKTDSLNTVSLHESLYCFVEKSQMLKEVEAEYKDLLRQLEEDEHVTREDIEAFKKNALVH
jgi:hypothetical protein